MFPDNAEFPGDHNTIMTGLFVNKKLIPSLFSHKSLYCYTAQLYIYLLEKFV